MSGVEAAAIRRLDTADLEAFRDLRQTALASDPAAFGAHPEDPEEAKREPEHWRWRLLRSPVLAAAAPGGRLLGMAGWYRGAGIKTAHRAFLWGLFVRPEARGRGLGHGLLRAVIAEVRAAGGVESLWAAVGAEQQAAAALYERLGFACWGVEPRALKLGERFLDERQLVLFLAPAGAVADGTEER